MTESNKGICRFFIIIIMLGFCVYFGFKINETKKINPYSTVYQRSAIHSDGYYFREPTDKEILYKKQRRSDELSSSSWGLGLTVAIGGVLIYSCRKGKEE